ncbi:MAG: hypothetical protein WCH34_09735 [Bacteroidota bacterium]
MLKHLRWKFNTFKKIQTYNVDHAPDVNAIPEYAADKTALNTAVLNIEADDVIITANNKGITEDTTAAKIDMVDTTYQFAHKALPKARAANANELVEKLDIEPYEITKASKSEALAISRGVKKVIEDHPLIFTNIEAEDLAELGDSITHYDAEQSKPATAIETKKITSHEHIIEEFKNGEAAIENMQDHLIGKYYKSKRSLIKEFKNCRAIEIDGVHHTGLIVTCKQANPPAGAFPYEENVLCKIVERNREVLTDINGIGTIIKFKGGTCHVEFSKVGLVTKTMVIMFRKGHIEEVEVVMERVS